MTSPAVALADDSASATSPGSSASESSPESESESESASASDPSSTTSPQNGSATAQTTTNAADASESESVKKGVIVRSSGGAISSGVDLVKIASNGIAAIGNDIAAGLRDLRPAKLPAVQPSGVPVERVLPTPSSTPTTPLPNPAQPQVIPTPGTNNADGVVDTAATTNGENGLLATEVLSRQSESVPAALEQLTADALTPQHTTLRTTVDETADPIAELTVCACQAINQVIAVIAPIGNTIGELLLPIIMPPTPEDPTESPVMWAVLAWVRRQADEILALPPIADATTAVNSWIAQLTTAIVTCGQPSTELPEEFERTVVVSGLDAPTDFEFLPDGRIILTEKTGAIKIFENGDTPSEPITLVVLPTQNESEKGLTGIELDPNLTVDPTDGHINGFIYVAYTGADNHDRLSRLTVVDSVVTDEFEIMVSPEEAGPIHHGGEIEFGPDGMLYWATGDNSLSTNAQDLTNIHGKIMRIDPVTLEAPADNPFVGVTVDGKPAVPEIYAYGLRNPFRFTFTPDGETMLVGDVGNTAWEELNVVTAGANYGWPRAEGTCQGCGYVDPLYTYPHTAAQGNAGSITSVLVYDASGPGLPDEYDNKVFIADYTLGWIKVLTFDDEYTSLISEQTFDSEAGTTVKLLQGPDGNIYQLNIYPGELSRIAPSDGNRAPTAVITTSQTNGPSPLVVDFSAANSTDPENDTLTYSWDFGDGTTSTGATATKTFTTTAGVATTYDVTLTVSDGEKTDQTTQRITVGSTAPVAEITSPVMNANYSAGDVITFTGTGSDAEDTPDELDYKWTVVFHHAQHVHPFEDDITGQAGSVTIPRDPHNVADSFYRITLTVTDSSGLSSTDSVDVKPNLANLTFTSNDPSATYTIDGIPHTGTYTEQGVVGVERVISAPSQGQYVFANWSDGGAQTHTITTPAGNTTYTANFTTVETAGSVAM